MIKLEHKKFEYKKIEIKSPRDIKYAERLQSKGWKVINVGINSMLLERQKNT